MSTKTHYKALITLTLGQFLSSLLEDGAVCYVVIIELLGYKMNNTKSSKGQYPHGGKDQH